METYSFDLVIVGGGLSGVCAAIAAARLGTRVALIQNRPVLGGNSSSEIRVWVCGATATGHQRFARETGIVGELYLENQFTNPLGNPYYWDLVLLEAVRREPNISLFLNTECLSTRIEENRLRSVTCHVIGSERTVTFQADLFADCSGDGIVAAHAGAEYLVGREAKAEYDEAWAPEVADATTLGSTLLFYTRTEPEVVPFVAPSFAIDVTSTTIPESRILRTGDNGADYWWIEWGGELDVVKDNERIRDELWAVIYGIWDYIKNSGKFAAEDLTLEWVGAVPGKREYRRVLGDHVMTQHDVQVDVVKHDAVGFGGWSIDLHPAQGVYEPAGAAQQLYPDGVYDIPFRSLFSRNIENLLVAGRNVSASHVAFGSLRVMATCGVMGEAAGTAAALCLSKRVDPRELARSHSSDLQQLLIKQDASLVGVAHNDPANIAPSAQPTASSSLYLDGLAAPTSPSLLDSDIGVLFPVSHRVDGIDLYLSASEDTELEYTLFDTVGPRSYVPGKVISRGSQSVKAGYQGWVNLPMIVDQNDLPVSSNVIVIAYANPALSFWLSEEYVFGVLAMVRRASLDGHEIDDHVAQDSPNDVVRWGIKPLNRRRPGIQVHGDSSPFDVRNICSEFSRPFGGPQIWSSDRMAEGSAEWVQLTWDEPVSLKEIRLVFNDDVNEYMNNLHYARTPFRVMPELVSDYEISADLDGIWTTVCSVEGNRSRHRIHEVDVSEAKSIRISVTKTNGSPFVQIVSIRAYSSTGPLI